MMKKTGGRKSRWMSLSKDFFLYFFMIWIHLVNSIFDISFDYAKKFDHKNRCTPRCSDYTVVCSLRCFFKIEYFSEITTEIEFSLACLSGSQMGLNNEKYRGRKSSETLPLRNILKKYHRRSIKETLMSCFLTMLVIKLSKYIKRI